MKSSIFIIILVVALSTLPLFTQQETPFDDRDMFIKSQNTSTQVRANVCILADNSGSMNTAIYHPSYNSNIDYTDGNTLDGISTIFSGSSNTLSASTTFKLCRGASTTETVTARGNYTGHGTPQNKWNITLTTPTIPFVVGKTLSYYYNNQWRTTTISAVDCNGNNCIVTVAVTNRLPSRTGVTSQYQRTVPDDHTALIIANSSSCSSASPGSTEYQIRLYGTRERNNSDYAVRYDTNYLHWLAFFATPTQLNEVTNWANTGNFPKADNPAEMEFAGYTRMKVLRDVLKDVVQATYTNVNYGLFAFDTSDSNDTAGGTMNEPMSNKATGGTLNNFLNNVIGDGTGNGLYGDTWTPLSEALADVWVYFRGGQNNNYRPASEFDSNCGHGVGGGFPTSCPIQYYCQKNFVIVMTDGQSTKDDWRNNKFGGSSNCLFKESIANWGDGDNHDPNVPSDAQPYNFTPPYCGEETCWMRGSGGTDLLDDVAYYVHKNDMFPDSRYADMPGLQNLVTYAIGFTIHNQLLAETALNGGGVYYTASSYTSLKTSFKNAIYDIMMKDACFAAFTAPKKVTSTIGEGYTYVGYFHPSQDAIWQGFLHSYKVMLDWCPDSDGNGTLEAETECGSSYDTEYMCENANPGKSCLPHLVFGRYVDAQHPAVAEWTAEIEISNLSNRKLYTSAPSTPTTIFQFDLSHWDTLLPLFGALDETETKNIINKTINGGSKVIPPAVDPVPVPFLADIFHSDISFVGTPPQGKTFLLNINPPECNRNNQLGDPDCYQWFYENKKSRNKVLYVGTNDGVFHQFNAQTDSDGGGTENWGYIPDEVLSTLKRIHTEGKYSFTVDGRAIVDDIYFRSGNTGIGWKTLLVYGLKDGGDAFYAMDVTDPTTDPIVLWKFKYIDPLGRKWSGKSWSKPIIGKIRQQIAANQFIDRWVVVLAGGNAFNNENPDSREGKAIFVIDASSGELIWMLGFDNTDGWDDPTSGWTELRAQLFYPGTGNPGYKMLTKESVFNHPIPSAIVATDRDGNGYLDTIYFANTAGNLFKTDMSNIEPGNWTTYQLFKNPNATYPYPVSFSKARISAIATQTDVTLDIAGAPFILNTVIVRSSAGVVKGLAVVETATNRDITLVKMPVDSVTPDFTLAINDTIQIVPYDPIYLSPAVWFDSAYNLWVGFGTGDRIRSRTSPTSGKFVVFKDAKVNQGGIMQQKTDLTTADLTQINWTVPGTMPASTVAQSAWGWYFTFPEAALHEKFFDPETLVLPDAFGIPHIYFNTYQPTVTANADPCKIDIGKMLIYNIKMKLNANGSSDLSGDSELGRIAGGGVFGEPMVHVLYIGEGTPGSIPPPKDDKENKFNSEKGRYFFWKQENK